MLDFHHNPGSEAVTFLQSSQDVSENTLDLVRNGRELNDTIVDSIRTMKENKLK